MRLHDATSTYYECWKATSRWLGVPLKNIEIVIAHIPPIRNYENEDEISFFNELLIAEVE